MGKINDYELAGATQEQVDFKDDVITVINFGKYAAQAITSIPTWTGNNGEFLFTTVAGQDYMYVYKGGSWGGYAIQGANAVIKSWGTFNGATGTVAVLDSYNVSSFTRNALGVYTVGFTNAFANTAYCVQVCATRSGSLNGLVMSTSTQLVGSFQFQTEDDASTARDGNPIYFMAVGQ